MPVPKKAKTPRPPRPVQAPKRRDSKPARATGLGGLTSRWQLVSGAAIAIVLVVVVVLATGGGGSSSINEAAVKKAMTTAGCTYRSVKPFPPKKDPTALKGGYHEDVPSLSTPTKGLWSTSPPSGGAHYGLWAVWGFYRQPVNPRRVVHNEEHGGVIIWWGPAVPSATVDKLHRFYLEQPVGVFGTPIAGLGRKIALTAWTADPTFKGEPGLAYFKRHYGMGHVAVCPRFDQHAFAVFRDAYRGKSPQGFPVTADRPGCGPETNC